MRRFNLVAHQSQQGRDDQRRPCTLLPHQLGRDEIDHALAPSGALHTKQPPALVYQLVDSLPLAVAEVDGRIIESNAEPGECGGVCSHGKWFPQGLRNRLRILVNAGLGGFPTGYSAARTVTGTRRSTETYAPDWVTHI